MATVFSYDKAKEHAEKLTPDNLEVFLFGMSKTEFNSVQMKNLCELYCAALKGATREDFHRDIRGAKKKYKAASAAPSRDDGEVWDVPNTYVDGGYIYTKPPKGMTEGHRLCKKFAAVGLVKSTSGATLGLGIQTDKGALTVSLDNLYDDQKGLAKQLSKHDGLHATVDGRHFNDLANLFNHYMGEVDPPLPILTEAEKPGWVVCPELYICANGDVIGTDPGGRLITLGAEAGYEKQEPGGHGSAAKEKEVYSEICSSGPAGWILGLLFGLASAAQGVLGCHNYGIFLGGSAKQGKSTFQRVQTAVAGSPDETKGQGGYIQVAGNTVAFEVPAKRASGSPFALDEAGRMKDPGKIGELIFTLYGGSGNKRMKPTGVGNREQHMWDCFASISSEQTPAQMMESAGKKYVAGMGNRYPTLEITDVCPQSPANALLAQKIEKELCANYGHTLSIFVRDALIGIDCQQAVKEWRELCVKLADGDVGLANVAEMFAVCWWVGLQAARVKLFDGLTDKKVEQAVKAVWDSFKGSEIATRLTPGEIEKHRLEEAISGEWNRRFVHILSVNDKDGSFGTRQGYYISPGEEINGEVYKDGIIFVLTDELNAITKGAVSTVAICKKLRADGLLIPDPKSDRSQWEGMPGRSKARCIAVNYRHFAPEHANPRAVTAVEAKDLEIEIVKVEGVLRGMGLPVPGRIVCKGAPYLRMVLGSLNWLVKNAQDAYDKGGKQ